MNKDSKNKNMIITLGIILVFIFGVWFTIDLVYQLNINKYKKYAEEYVEDKLNLDNYEISYNNSGKCIVDGDCVIDFAMGIDGGACKEYTYAENCKSYYFNVTSDEQATLITVFEKNGVIKAIEGKNINGK